MTELAINFLRGIWGREVLRRKVEQLEARFEAAQRLIKTLLETNRAQGVDLLRIEEENKQLTTAVNAWEEANRFIDPNAKCPVCGARDGFLSHIPNIDPRTKVCTDVVAQNNCKVCGSKFISGEPVAGRQMAARLYQPDLPKIIVPDGRE